MKPKNLVKKLQFKKQEIAKLNLDEAANVKGGSRVCLTDATNCSGITCVLCDTIMSCEYNKCFICAH